jgi:hypothetical protein
MTGLRVLLGRVWATLAGRRDDRVREEIDTHLAGVDVMRAGVSQPSSMLWMPRTLR